MIPNLIPEHTKDKSEKNVSKIRGAAIILFTVLLVLSFKLSRERLNKNEIRLVFYNVENLFDTLDSVLDDDEFLPDGVRRWDWYKYNRKLNNISKVLIACSNRSAPDIIGLCEVENSTVLDHLCSKTILREVGYRTLFAQSKDRRGIGVGLLYKSNFELLRSEIIYPVRASGDTIETRSILYAEMADSFDTLRLFITHWPSRRGGVSASDKLRQDVASLIGLSVERLNKSDSRNLNIIIMGDLNANPGDMVVKKYLSGDDSDENSIGRLINISSYKGNEVQGSYKYQGRWNMYDQVLIDSSLMLQGHGYRYLNGSFRVLDNENILVDDLSYRGKKPGSTWNGPAYNGLYSDHLPVYFDLEVKEY